MFILSGTLFAEVPRPRVDAPYVLLMNAENGKVLYDKKGYDKIYPASTTKVATALYLVTHFSHCFDDQVLCEGDILKYVTHEQKKESGYTLPSYWLQKDGTRIWIYQGEVLPFRMLMYAMMLISANDAANALANHVAKDVPTFVENVNAFVKSIGCNRTHFTNPHGFDHPEHYSTPYDMALIASAAVKNPVMRDIMITEEYERTKTRYQPAYIFKQSNRLVRSGKYYYPFAFGLKTGNSENGLCNLLAAATNGNRTLVAAIHKAANMNQCYRDAITLFDAFFGEMPVTRLLFSAEDTVLKTAIKEAKMPLSAILKQDVTVSYYPSEEPAIKTEVMWYKLSLPIKKGDKVGELVVRSGHNVLLHSAIYAKEAVKKKLSVKCYNVLTSYKTWLLIVMVIVIRLFLRRSATHETV